MDNIIYHKQHSLQTTFPTHLTEGSVNPLKRTSYKQIININSKFRDDYHLTPSTDFYLTIPGNLNKVTSLALVRVSMPNQSSIYTVNSKTGSNNFQIKVDNGNYITIDISSGNYSGDGICDAINQSITNNLSDNNLPYNDISCNFDSSANKIRFGISPTLSCQFNFEYREPIITSSSDISFCKNEAIFAQKPNSLYNDQLTLGWLLGFRGKYMYKTPKNAVQNSGLANQNILSRKDLRNLSSIHPVRSRLTEVKNNGMQYLQSSYKCCGQQVEETDISFTYIINQGDTTLLAESTYESNTNQYYLLSINDFQNNNSKPFISLMQDESLDDAYILGKIFNSDCNCQVDSVPRIYFGPTNINRLHIKLFDQFGRIVDLNNNDFSFSLEIELLYDL